MNVKCPKCQKIFETNTRQEQILNQAISKNMSLIMIKCPECRVNVPINPKESLSIIPSKNENNTSIFECPICGGIVSFIENDADGSFYGCGECGSIWRKQENLMREISEVKKGKSLEYKSFERD